MIDVSTAYAKFLARLDGVLLSQGARTLLPDSSIGLPPWSEGWDRVYFVDSPGNHSIYGFMQADRVSRDTAQKRYDQLTEGLAAAFQMNVAQLEVVAVEVFVEPVDPEILRAATRATPSRYVPGLRPRVWALDAAQGVLSGPRRFRRPETAGWIERAARSESEVLDATGADIHESALTKRQQLESFYAMVRSRRPVVTIALIAANVLMYALVTINGGPQNYDSQRRFGALVYTLALHGQWWRLFTMMFLHASPEHILFNMTSLFAVGTLAERLYGHAKFLTLYILSGLVASSVSLAWASLQGQTDAIAVGASGAIFGIAGTLLTLPLQPSDVIPRQLRERVTASMLPLVLVSLFFSQFLSANVDSSAHIGGLLGGALLSLIFRVTRFAPEAAASAY